MRLLILAFITFCLSSPVCAFDVLGSGEVASESGGNPIAFEQDNDALSSGQTATIVLGSAVTTGSLIEVTCALGNNGIPVWDAPTDSESNTYTQTARGLEGTSTIEKWYAWNVTGGSSFTVTVVRTSSNDWAYGCNVAEYSGIQTSSDPLDQAEGNGGSSTAATTANTSTLAQANELVTQGAVSLVYGTVTHNANFIEISHIASTSNDAGGTSGYKIVSSTDAVAADITLHQDNDWGCVLGTYRGQ